MQQAHRDREDGHLLGARRRGGQQGEGWKSLAFPGRSTHLLGKGRPACNYILTELQRWWPTPSQLQDGEWSSGVPCC